MNSSVLNVVLVGLCQNYLRNNRYGPIVNDLVRQIEQTGLRVRGVTTDMGSPNQAFWR